MALTERFDPATARFAASEKPTDDPQGNPVLAASLPKKNAVDVSIDTQIALRFTRPLDVSTVSAATLSLTGPGGVIGTKVVPAEGGRLAFLKPQNPLIAGTEYVVLLNAPMALNGRHLTGDPIRFKTAPGRAGAVTGPASAGDANLRNLASGGPA